MTTPEITRFSCGCEVTTGMHDGKRTFMIRPHAEGCQILRMVLEMADEIETPVEMMGLRDELTVTCLHCGKVMDGFMPAAGDAIIPEPGSLSVCAYCAALAIFERNPDGDLYLREMTPEEADQIAQDPEVGRVITAVKRVQGQ